MPTSLRSSIFWPLECKDSGFIFGWANTNNNINHFSTAGGGGSITVAGVTAIPFTESEFESSRLSLSKHLEQIQNRNQYGHTVYDLAGLGTLRLLGKCTFGETGRVGGLREPVLDLDLDGFGENEYDIVFYHRHQANSLRFYSLDALRLDVDASNHTKQPSKDSNGITQKVVDQLNIAGVISAAVHQSSFPSSGRPLHTSITRISDLLINTFSVFLLIFSRPIQTICNTPIIMSALSLKDVSLSVQQMDVRTEQVSVLARQMADLRARSGTSGKNNVGRVEVYSIKYTSFFNTVWLILNDITIGYAFGNFLCENHIVLARLARGVVEETLISLPQTALRWLDSWPAGLKLNTELSRFYSGTFVDLVDVWEGVLRHFVFPHLSNTIYIFGFISSYGALIGGLGGMTMSIALLYDMFVVFTLHIYVCYAITGFVYERVLWGMGSLWRLFRGKRINVLRNRTDSWEYDIDQLLFGTILFTLLAFLFPTVLAYYALFALLRLSTILIQASLEMLLAFMNHFPLFVLVLRVKDAWRLPAGVYFDFVGVENQPVTLGRIFFQYTRLWTRLASHYNPLRLLKSVLWGRFLVPIPRHEIRYDKIGIGVGEEKNGGGGMREGEGGREKGRL
ncbi:hypothetical protein GYMLUDRAFT_230709 [Collybiopsis luxurians FD-317 M1]|uniref:Gpi1-domain-containing protein n=1 Tax=Collybiopsis luxurians FD-317 M1 TaxID=944289 RepID=A0A0D0CC56_9AGAR|nr:hypothetical protein GYMLUDRAFT_230709 [Collybiopsis luxurians FD-317 M1]